MSAYENLRKQFDSRINCTADLWNDIIESFEPICCKKSQYLVKTGEVEHHIYYVKSGVLRAFHLKDGQEVCIAFAYENTFCSSYASFISKLPSEYYIDAISDSELLALPYPKVQELFNKYHTFERWGRLMAEEILIGKEKRELAILSFSAEERYRRLLHQSPHVFQFIPQKYLASYLGMSPETFSRLRQKVK